MKKYVGITLCIVLILMMFGLFNQTTKSKGKVVCDSGFIGLDVEAYNDIEEKSCDKFPQWTTSYNGNFSCSKEDLQLKHIKLKNIEGLNCHAVWENEQPVWLELIGLTFWLNLADGF